MAVALREILASFGVEFDSKELEKGDSLVDQMVDKLAGFGKIVAGAFVVDKLVGWSKALIDDADALREAGIALGFPIQQLQQLEYAASLAGVEAGLLRSTLAKLQRTTDEMSRKGPSDTFKKLGIDVKQADGAVKSSAEIFEELAGAISRIEEPNERARVAAEIFGKSYTKLLPLLAEGEEGIKKLKAEVGELGAEFDDAFAENADEFNDNLTRLRLGLRGLMLQALGPLLPDLVELSKQAIRITKTFVAWVKQSEIAKTALIAVTGAGVLALMRALKPLGALILRTFLPLLLLEDFLVFLSGGDSEIGALIEQAFGPGSADLVKQFFDQVKGGFEEMTASARNNTAEFDRTWSQALDDMRKELEETFGPHLTGVIVAAEDTFFAFVKALSGGFSGVLTFLTGVAQGIWFQFKLVWDDIEYAALITVASIQDAFANLWNRVSGGAAAALGRIGKLIGKVPGLEDFGKELQSVQFGTLEASNRNVVEGVASERNRERFAEAEQIATKLGLNGSAAVAPINGPGVAPTLNQQNSVQIVQNITAGTPAAVAREAGKGASAGVTKGIDLRAARDALAPTAG